MSTSDYYTQQFNSDMGSSGSTISTTGGGPTWASLTTPVYAPGTLYPGGFVYVPPVPMMPTPPYRLGQFFNGKVTVSIEQSFNHSAGYIVTWLSVDCYLTDGASFMSRRRIHDIFDYNLIANEIIDCLKRFAPELLSSEP